VAINDVYDLANLPRLQTFLARLDVKPSAITVAGDFLSPSTLSSIDGGRGMVATLRATGVTHVSFGNHEADIRLDQMYQRLKTLSKSTQILNTNMRQNLPNNASWMEEITNPYSIIQSPCERVKVALLGMLSDEPGLFRDNTFKGIPIGNVIDTFQNTQRRIYDEGVADFILPLTHASLFRDKELARAMLDSSLYQNMGVILGGHEHEPYDEVVHGGSSSDDGADGTSTDSMIRIFKSGMDAQAAGLIDLTFDCHQPDNGPAKLVDINYELVEMNAFEPSIIVQSIVDKHMAVIKNLENEVIIDINSTVRLPPGIMLSSERTRFEQTTVGSIFCQMIKEERETDAAMINGATIKGGMSYFDGKMSYAQLKKELPFPTKLVIIPIPRYLLDQAIHYSRTAIEEVTDPDLEDVPRRGYLQLDWDYEHKGNRGFPDDILTVALPRNLLNGFCKIQPLMDWAKQLKAEGIFPGPDDHIPALEVVVRHACKNRWKGIVGDLESFNDFDLNGDGVLDRHEIKEMMTHFLGHEPADFVVDDMLASIDDDENGFIDQGEFSFALAEIERQRYSR